MMATGFREGIFAEIIWMIDVRGTERNIPAIPQIYPQIASEMRITNGEIFSWTP